MLQLGLMGPSGQVERVEVEPNMKAGDLKAFAEAFFGIPAANVTLVCNQQNLEEGRTLTDLNVKHGDMVQVVASTQAPAQAPRAAPRPPGGGKVQWDGMSMDDVFENNTNPEHICDIFQSNEQLLKELNFHNPDLAKVLRQDKANALPELRRYLIANQTTMTLNRLEREAKEQQMRRRLEANANDAEAKAYFDEKNSEQLVQESYMTMMRDYPEALSRVLMLYINVEINGVHLQAFVDSGAQSSVISARCAKKCNITQLIDKRFAGKVVGVGTGQTLGRVHVVPLNIDGNFFPMSLTVMDDSKGLGDSNMEFLLGLDMLKRHRCDISLSDGKLYFQGAAGRVSTPFLHEYDLPETKGGTKGYNPNVVEGGEASGANLDSAAVSNEDAIAILMSEGSYTREQVVDALQQANNDIELAKTLLMFGK